MNKSMDRRSIWWSALRKAALLEVALVLLLGIPLFVPVPIFQGADNPLWFYAAAILQFPASIAFGPLLPAFEKLFGSQQSMYAAGLVVVILETMVFCIWFRFTSRPKLA